MEDRSKIDAKAKKASATMGTDFGNPETHKKVLAGAASDGERAVVESHDPVSRAVMARLSSIVGALSPQLQQSGIENLRSLSHAETALYLISAYRSYTKVT